MFNVFKAQIVKMIFFFFFPCHARSKRNKIFYDSFKHSMCTYGMADVLEYLHMSWNIQIFL